MLGFVQNWRNIKEKLEIDFSTIESFRFWDEDDYEYEIFSVLSSTSAWTSIILAGKHDSRSHSTTSFSENVVVAGTSIKF